MIIQKFEKLCHVFETFDWHPDETNQPRSYREVWLWTCMYQKEHFSNVWIDNLPMKGEVAIISIEFFSNKLKLFHWELIEIKTVLSEKHTFEYRDESMKKAPFRKFGIEGNRCKEPNQNWLLVNLCESFDCYLDDANQASSIGKK